MQTLRDRLKTRNYIVGVGSALVDILSHESDEFVKQAGAAKGSMTLVEQAFIESTLKKVTKEPSIVPGGSACNTIVGVSRLGGKSRFVGKCGSDPMGKLFCSDLQKQNVQPAMFSSNSSTGRVLSIITPDAQRSMFTYLGAAAEIQPEDITTDSFSDAAIVHIEGYLIANPALILSALQKAKEAGAAVSLDLASFNVVEESKEQLEDLVEKYVDILIANEDEAHAFTGHKDEAKALDVLAGKAELAVLKVGARGSYIKYQGDVVQCDPVRIDSVVDTTGAGDLWASGFLFGLVNGYELEKCGRLGSICGAEVCQVIGANIPEDRWEHILKMVEK